MFRITPDGKKEEVHGLLLLDAVRPDELEGEAKTTPARELFDLMRDACLGKLTNTMVKSDGTIVPINGAAYNVALRMQNSPKAADIVIALVGQYPWLRNQYTKRLIRSAMQIIKTSRQPMTTPCQPTDDDDDPNLIISVIDDISHDSESWASVVATDMAGNVITTIANGSIFNPHAVSPDKKLKDEPVKNKEEAMLRFADQLSDPPPTLLAKLQLIRDAAAGNRSVFLKADAPYTMQQATLVASAVRRLRPTSTAPRRAKQDAKPKQQPEYQIIERMVTDLETGKPVKIQSRLPAEKQVKKMRRSNTTQGAAGGHGVLPARFEHLIERTVTDLETGKPVRIWSHLPTEEYLVRIGGIDMEDNSYTGEPLAAPEPQVISGRWRRKADKHWQYEIRRRKPKQAVPEDNEEMHEFRHRTRYADGRIHGEERNMRFGQHDDEFFMVSALEEIEHKLAIAEADRWTMDLTMMDNSIDLGVAKFLSQQIDDGIRRRSRNSCDDARAGDTADPTRPNWWKRTVDTRKKAERTIKVMEPAVVTDVVLKEEHRHGRHVIITTWERGAKVTTIYSHMEEIKVTAGQRLKAGDVIGTPEPPLVLPARLAAEVSTVKDCKIKRIGPNGALLEGWVVPTNYQLAGTRRLLKVAECGRVLTRAEQQARNGGDCWEYPNIAPSGNRPPVTGQNLPILRKPKARASTTWPQPAGPAHRYFAADPTWHEPLSDDDTRHVIITLNDSEHALARLVAALIQ